MRKGRSTGPREHEHAPELSVGVRYQTLASCVIRKTAELESERTGELGPGQVIVAIETKDIGSTTRVKFDRGWTSMTARNGTQLLQIQPAQLTAGLGDAYGGAH
jgi:hypothetical protein